MDVYVFMVVVHLTVVFMGIIMCEFVQEIFSLFSPCSCFYRCADQTRRGKVKDGAGGESRELRCSDSHIYTASSSFFLIVNRVVAYELMNGTCKITLGVQRAKRGDKKIKQLFQSNEICLQKVHVF